MEHRGHLVDGRVGRPGLAKCAGSWCGRRLPRGAAGVAHKPERDLEPSSAQQVLLSQALSLTICFHNGGRYDFHFLLRAFAKLKHVNPKTSDVRKSGSSRVGYRPGKIRKFGVKELAARVQESRLQGLVDSLPGDVVARLRKFKVSILQKSGETNLVMRFGALRFINTMNFCKAGLGGLIESHRRSALKTVSLGGRSEVRALSR